MAHIAKEAREFCFIQQKDHNSAHGASGYNT